MNTHACIACGAPLNDSKDVHLDAQECHNLFHDPCLRGHWIRALGLNPGDYDTPDGPWHHPNKQDVKPVDVLSAAYQKGVVAGMHQAAGILQSMAVAAFERRDDDWAVQLREMSGRLIEEARDVSEGKTDG